MSAAIMMQPFGQTSPRYKANLGIVLFLATVLTGAAAAFMRSRLVVPRDPLSVADLLSVICYIAMTMLFYQLFRSVDKRVALLTASFSMLSCVSVAFGSFFHVVAMFLLRGAEYLNLLSVRPVPTLVLMCLQLRAQAYAISLVFFALYCLSSGYLLFKIARTSIPVLLVLIALPIFAATDVELIKAGRAALERGDADQAVEQLEKAVAAKPTNPEAHYYLGQAYGLKAQKAGMFGGLSLIDKAKGEWLRALELDPNSVETRLRLIEFYTAAPGMAGGSEEKALEQAAELKKRGGIDAHRGYARIYTMQKKYDLAIKELADAVREQPKSAKAHYYLGNGYLNAKDWKNSLHEYEFAVSLDANYMPPYFRIGQNAAQSETNYARGEEVLRKYLQYKPVDEEPSIARAWYWLGMIQEHQGKKAEARQSYLNAQKLMPDAKDIAEALKRVS